MIAGLEWPVTAIDGTGVRVVPAAAGDLDAILELEAAGFADTERWSRQSWQSQLDGHLDSATFRVLLARDADDRILGVITIRLAGETADLDRVITAPDARRRGVARTMIDSALAQAAEAGAESMLLEVDADNVAAVGLYRGAGFTELTVRTDYYGPGRDALIMTRPLERRNR